MGFCPDVGKSKFVSIIRLAVDGHPVLQAGLNWIKGHAVCVCVYTLCHEA